MNLPSPITIQPPAFTRKDGEVRSFPAVTMTSLNVTIHDNAEARVCSATIQGVPMGVTLWQGDEYDAAGDYTQSQAEARLLEVLGPDIQAKLQSLFPQAR